MTHGWPARTLSSVQPYNIGRIILLRLNGRLGEGAWHIGFATGTRTRMIDVGVS